MNATWKSTERQIASRLGGQRIPVSGRGRGSTPDIEHPRLSIEVKHRATLPAWLHDAMAQAIAARRGERIPVVVLHEEGQRFNDAFCVVRLGDLTKLLEGVTP